MLSSEQDLLHYRLLEKIGEGGMGVVWKALDTTLDREVAIKLLPEELAKDPGRLARFVREAKVLAALNHPAIAGIHSVHESDGVHFLAMELVLGEDLSGRLSRGPIPVKEALLLARQIADALQAAHEQGVIHRDLKPANVRLTPDGQVKLLDFGLAKALASEVQGDSLDPALSPTLTALGTQVGVILGTASYMSPEQAAGRPVDERADIWAFGAVLWEMLVGQRLFRGKSVSDVLASVIKDEPDFGKLPKQVPATIRRLLKRCLRKESQNRLQAIGDARVVLDDFLAGRIGEEAPAPDQAALKGRRRGLSVLLGIAAIVVGALTGLWWRGPEPLPEGSPVRWRLALPDDAALRVQSYPGSALAVSSDGKTIAYSVEDGPIHVRRMDELEVRALPGTESGRQPFFSPDGAWVGYFNATALRKAPITGGRPVTIVRDLPNADWLRANWSEDGRIIFDTWNGGLRVVSADGGPVQVLTSPEDELQLDPQFLPGGGSFVYTVVSSEGYRIETRSMDGADSTVVLENASFPRYLTSGHLLFVREGGLMVAPFDAETRRVNGNATPLPISTIVDHPNMGAPTPQLVVSANGTLVYAPLTHTTRPSSTVLRVDRQGRKNVVATLPYAWPHFTLSPDARQLLVSGREGGEIHIGIFDFGRQTLTRIRTDRFDYPADGVWAPDGKGIYFSRFGPDRSEVLFQPVDGSPARQVVQGGGWLVLRSISADGRYLAIFSYHPETGGDIWYLDTEEQPARLRPYLVEPDDQFYPSLSPDGQWIAYVEQSAQDYSVFVRRFPSGGSRTKIYDLGNTPLWSGDGKQLFFMDDSGERLFGVTFESSPELQIGKVRLILQGNYQASTDFGHSYAVAPDGLSFLLVPEEVEYRASDQLIIVQNWLQEVKQLFKYLRSGLPTSKPDQAGSLKRFRRSAERNAVRADDPGPAADSP